jgi:hypothetical protein
MDSWIPDDAGTIFSPKVNLTILGAATVEPAAGLDSTSKASANAGDRTAQMAMAATEKLAAVIKRMQCLPDDRTKTNKDHCMADAIKSGDVKDARNKFAELVDLFSKTAR